jgi:processive 1,2-diacylglycerol beta-glucosyltransferase
MRRRSQRSTALCPDPAANRAPRILVVSASMGAGHDGAARELRARLERSGHDVAVLDFLPLMPLRLGHFIRWFYGQQLAHAPGSYQWHYEKMQTNRFVMWVTWWYATWAKGRLHRRVRRWAPDAVVSTYPLASQALGTLRSQGRLPMPAVTFMTDFSVHPTWVNRHIDLHLTVSPATAADAAALSQRPAVSTGPLVPSGLAVPLCAQARAEARRELGLPVDGVVALVVAGSWGVGNITATVERLAAGGRVSPLVACGRNAELAAELARVPGVVALGWRSDMPRLLRASDVLVENAGGLTCMEAFQAGVPVVSHECLPGHGTHNAAVMAGSGVVTWVRDPDELADTILALAADPAGQRGRARALFAGDAAAVVAGLAAGRSLARAVADAGLVPVGVDGLARPSRTARARRRIAITGVTLGATFYAGTAGVAAATGLGVGVDTTYKRYHDQVVVVVRLSEQDLPATPALTAALVALHATAAVDRRLVHSRPGDLRTLDEAGVPLVNAGCGQDGGVHPTRARRDLVVAKRDLAAVDGDQTGVLRNVFVASRKLSALDLTTALLSDDRLVRPSKVVRLDAAPSAVGGGSLVLIDGRTGGAEALVSRRTWISGQLAGRHLRPAALAGMVGQD